MAVPNMPHKPSPRRGSPSLADLRQRAASATLRPLRSLFIVVSLELLLDDNYLRSIPLLVDTTCCTWVTENPLTAIG